MTVSDQNQPNPAKPWMMGDGQPGQIHELLLLCQQQAASIVAVKGEGKGTSAQDIIDSARAVLNEQGIILRIAGVDAQSSKQGGGLLVELHLSVHFCAPDGSYWPARTVCGAMAPNLKSYGAALTAGIKSILRHQLLLHVVQNERDAQPTAMPSELRAWHDVLLSFKTLDELSANSDHKSRTDLGSEHLDDSRAMYARRREELRADLSDEKLAFWDARFQESRLAEQAEKAGKKTPRAK